MGMGRDGKVFLIDAHLSKLRSFGNTAQRNLLAGGNDYAHVSACVSVPVSADGDPGVFTSL